MAKQIDLNKTTYLVIRYEEMYPNINAEEVFQDWLAKEKFKPSPEYGENYYTCKTLWSGTMFGILYKINESGDLCMNVHYSGPIFARPLDTKDVSIKARNRFSKSFHDLYTLLKQTYHYREMHEIFKC